MGKFYLTNNKEWYQELDSDLTRAGFKTSACNTDHNIFLKVFKKLSVDNFNFLSQGNNYVAMTGTLIYKGLFGKEALQKLLFDYLNLKGNTNAIRKNIIGAYCLIIKIEDYIDVFVDEAQNYYTHYYTDEKQFIITPQIYHIAKSAFADFDQISMMQEIASRTIPDNHTPFFGIYRLLGNQKMRIDCSTGEIKVLDIGVNTYYNQKPTTLKQAIDVIKRYNKSKKNVFDEVGIFCTGGLDSHCILAANDNIKKSDNTKKIELLNWSSDDESIPAASGDTDACREMSKVLDIPLKVFDCTESNIYENIRGLEEQEFDIYGELIGFHAGNKKYHQMLNNDSIPEFIEYGCGGEVANRCSRNGAYALSYEDILRFYMDYTSSKGNKHVNFEINCERWKEAWDTRLNILEISSNKITEKSCTDIYNFYVLNENLDHVNVTNLYRYSILMFGQNELIEVLSNLEMKDKLNGHASLYIVKELCPDLLDTPFFSHRQVRNVNLETLQLDELENKESFKARIKKNKIIGSIVSNIAEKYHEYLPHDKNEADKLHRKKLINLCKSMGDNTVKMNSFSEITYLAEYTTWVKMLNVIEQVKKKRRSQ